MTIKLLSPSVRSRALGGGRRVGKSIIINPCHHHHPVPLTIPKRYNSQYTSYHSIDVHTHMYLPRYMELLRSRIEVPRVVGVGGQDRLIILPGEDEELTTSSGRPIGDEYYSVERKLQYMDKHGIDISVISLANPWLDFLEGKEGPSMAVEINDEMQRIGEKSGGRLYGFGTVFTRDVPGAVKELERLGEMSCLRGIILGTPGRGNGLDDPELDPIYEAVERLGLVIFLHPHYGVGNQHFGGTGHSLFLALGFPFETTVAVSRLVLGGVMDRFPDLRLLVAHSGGTLHFLAGRLDSCVSSDPAVAKKLRHPPSYYLKKLYYDGVIYHRAGLQATMDVVGCDHIMWGTDHPFFPPEEGPRSSAIWPSTVKNYHILEGLDNKVKRAILSDNASRLLNIPTLTTTTTT